MLRGVEVMLKVSKCCPRTGSTNKIPLGNRCDSQEVIKTHNQNWVKKVTGEKKQKNKLSGWKEGSTFRGQTFGGEHTLHEGKAAEKKARDREI